VSRGHADEILTIPVGAVWNIGSRLVEGNLVVGGANLKITALNPTPELLASGYNVLSNTKDNQANFSIERNAGAAGGLPAGPLFSAVVQLDSAKQVVYPISVNILRINPNQPVCMGNNAVIVPAP